MIPRLSSRASSALGLCLSTGSRRSVSSISAFATLRDADAWSGAKPHAVKHLLAGVWLEGGAGAAPEEVDVIPDPLNGEPFLRVPRAGGSAVDLAPWVASLKSCPKTGLHNPFRSPERYAMLARVTERAARALRTPEISNYFSRLVQRTSPKSWAQATGEVSVVAAFLENFCGDNVRFLARSFGVPGDHEGQVSRGFRFPYGPVAIITPFNFPIEIPVLQLMGALYMGNRPLLKVDSKVSVVMEQFMRLLHACGLPLGDVDFIHTDGPTMNKLLVRAQPRMTLFTGSSRVAEKLARDLHGRVKLEDAGFDWKILGPDVANLPYVAWQSDQDAYACSGQKCSAQSMLFAHRAWVKAGIFDELARLAAQRNLADLSAGPVLTWTTARMRAHIDALLQIKGARLLFGGGELAGGNHRIPACYGAIEPTAVFVPLRQLRRARNFPLATTEVFGPVQVVTEYRSRDIDAVLDVTERLDAALTAGVVSNDAQFRNYVLGRTVNGTTYAGIRARTTGAPQNHWFGPSGDPRGAGIGTKEAIQLVWSAHREIVDDVGPIAVDWTTPKAN